MTDGYILIGLLIIFAFVMYFSKSSSITKTENISLDYNSTQGQIYNRFFGLLSEITFSYSLTIPISALLAVINQESSLRFKTKKNSEVKGDDGTSIGYMQVSINAVKDVNSMRGYRFSFTDLFEERKNLIVGSIYLDLCYQSAIKQNSSNPIKTAFKKYNGGIDETDSSKNTMATSYSNSAYNYFLIFKGYS